MAVPAWLDVGANLFSAFGTVGAFGIGMVLLRQEHKREEVRIEEQRRSQAVKVSAWLEATRNSQGGRDLFFFVHNASDMPIFEVSLSGAEADEDGQRCSALRGFELLEPARGDFRLLRELLLGQSGLRPQAPVHFLIVPKKRIPTLNDATEADAL